jgi:flavin-dependent dehydrogenase
VGEREQIVMPSEHYDVIIIGGRCAGASLALRLAGHNLKILLVDRAEFPSLPDVPSAPFIHPASMRLLDELGIEESEYAHSSSKVEYFILDMANDFHTVMPISQLNLDRSYFRGIDRQLFDKTLWNHTVRAHDVATRDRFSVTQIIKDTTGKVSGIIGRTHQGADETFTGDLVVGADGRFSFAASRFGARVVEEQNEFTTAVYHSEWRMVADYSPQYPHAITSYRTANGLLVLVIPVGDQKYHIGTVIRSADAYFGKKGFEQAYLQNLQSIPHLWHRLKDAHRATNVVGMRPIKNGYREAYGPNWALVGDAVHYKDPSDGQGIYDALLGSKLLAQSIIDWKQGNTSWETAGANYQQRLMGATYAMFKQTTANVKQSMYTKVPRLLNKTLIRWIVSSPEVQTQFLRYLSREISPGDYRPIPPNLPKIVINGLKEDFRRHFKSPL